MVESTPYHNFTILVVDDSDELRNSIIFDLKRKGFNILSANNGLTAFEIVKANKVDLVVSDIRMPGGDGLALLNEIRLHSQDIPVVILVTGFSDITEEECKKKGAKEVISKPFERKRLMTAVLETLNLKA